MFAIIGTVLFGIIVILTVLVACGAPLGEFTMSGKYKVLPPAMRILAALSVFIQAFAILILLQTAGIVPLWFSARATKNICIGYAVYLTLNTGMDAISPSKKEKYVITPLALVSAVCFWIVALRA